MPSRTAPSSRLGVWNAGTANVTGLAEPEQVARRLRQRWRAQALDVPPALGRWLGPADQAPRRSR